MRYLKLWNHNVYKSVLNIGRYTCISDDMLVSTPNQYDTYVFIPLLFLTEMDKYLARRRENE